jgi:PHD/YefM family antitoxin component YafN of YafNO toxin-antitoxin module
MNEVNMQVEDLERSLEACEEGPVVIERDGEPRAVLISLEAYEYFMELESGIMQMLAELEEEAKSTKAKPKKAAKSTAKKPAAKKAAAKKPAAKKAAAKKPVAKKAAKKPAAKKATKKPVAKKAVKAKAKKKR